MPCIGATPTKTFSQLTTAPIASEPPVHVVGAHLSSGVADPSATAAARAAGGAGTPLGLDWWSLRKNRAEEQIELEHLESRWSSAG